MNFRTQIPISKSSRSIDYDSKVVSLGSCFAVNLAEKLEYFKFKNTVNPFGILFHPLAIEKSIRFAVSGKEFGEDDVFQHNEIWHSFDTHSDCSRAEKDLLLQNLNTATKNMCQDLSESTHVIITLGTSWVYRSIASGECVANCHKVPQKEFSKELLTVEVILQSLENIISQIAVLNPNAAVIFTVSPVRHIKDGFVENQWSKANLISALQQIIQKQYANVSYFPSYEIMMDELRDYRFYAEDMLHPNTTAVDYIWNRFVETTISATAFSTMESIISIQKGLAHRPFQPEAKQHQEFLSRLHKSISELQKNFPHIDF